jgi:uroporphyrinogen decarboxylase
MIEGQGGTDFLTIKKMAYSRPDLLHHILKTTTEAISQYLHAQIEAGVDAIMIFDSWGGALSHQAYLEFSLPYMKVILSNLNMMSVKKIPSIMFTKGGGLWLDDQVTAGPDALGLDWQTDIKMAREKVGHQVALQGNLDPAILLSKPDAIEKEVKLILDRYGSGPGHIFNLGHGITEHTPPEHVDVMLNTVRSYSQQFHT